MANDLAPSGAPPVELLSASVVYDGFQALAPTTLRVQPREFVGVIGPSGCGKSTLLRLVANLVAPTDGRIAWWRGDFSRVGDPGRRLSFVFQDPTLMPWTRVARNVRLPLDLQGVPRQSALPRVEQALRQVGLAGAGGRFPRQLSGGMRMRVSIARALITEPDLLLMDEPFGALDEFTRNRLDEDLLALSAQRALTTIFVTHSMLEAIFLSSRILVMAASPGRIFREVAVPEPSPRDDAFRRSARFGEIYRELSQALADASVTP